MYMRLCLWFYGDHRYNSIKLNRLNNKQKKWSRRVHCTNTLKPNELHSFSHSRSFFVCGAPALHAPISIYSLENAMILILFRNISFLLVCSVDLDHILCSWKYSMYSYRTLLAISWYTLVMRNDYQHEERFCFWIGSMETREHTHSTDCTLFTSYFIYYAIKTWNYRNMQKQNKNTDSLKLTTQIS